MSPHNVTVHLAPGGLARLLVLSDRALRLALVLMDQAPDGEYIGGERHLAAATGISSAELRLCLAEMAGGKEPLLEYGPLRRRQRNGVGKLVTVSQLRVRLLRAQPFIFHPTGEDELLATLPPRTKASLAPPASGVGLQQLAASLARDQPEVALLTVAWLEHLASLHGRPLSPGTQTVHWSLVAKLLAEHGPGLVSEGLRSAILHVTTASERPDRYLSAAVEGLAASPRASTRKGKSSGEVDF